MGFEKVSHLVYFRRIYKLVAIDEELTSVFHELYLLIRLTWGVIRDLHLRMNALREERAYFFILNSQRSISRDLVFLLSRESTEQLSELKVSLN